MLEILLLLISCLASLTIYSPDELKQTLPITIFPTFGNPSPYSTVGKLVPVNITSCIITSTLPSYSFALIDTESVSGCFFDDIFLSVQVHGGLAAILIMPDDIGYKIILSNSPSTADLITITGFGLIRSVGEQLLHYSFNEIWVSYSLDIAKTSDLVLQYYFTSDYPTDMRFFTNLQILINNVPLTRDQFVLGFIYARPTDTGINNTRDCIDGDVTYCVPAGSTANGKDKLLSTVSSLNYYKSLQGSQAVQEIVRYLLDLYSNCSGNYSLNCTEQVLIAYQSIPDTSLAILAEAPVQIADIFITYFTIGNNPFFWENYLTSLYCFTSMFSISGCPACSNGCSYSDLAESTCTATCNASSCGFDEMKCLERNNCYSFMLGDGNCNAQCLNDPDCISGNSDFLILIVVLPIIGCLM